MQTNYEQLFILNEKSLHLGHLYFFSVELTATSLIASYSREQAEPAAVVCSGPRWMKHICHSTKAMLLGK